MKGYLITNENDTVYGLIDYRQWISSPSEIYFKKSDNDEKTRIRPADVQFIYVEQPNELYFSISTTIMVRPHKNSVQHKNEPKWFSGFAHVLVRGHLSLFLVKLEGIEYFILKLPEGNLEELVLKRQQVKVNEVTTLRDFPVYQSTLERLENDCEGLKGLSRKTQFKEKDFISFVSRYNTCVTGFEGTVTTLNKKYIKYLGLIGGYNFGVYNVSGRYEQLFTGTMLTNTFAFGGFLMAYLPRGQGRLGFYYDLLYKPVRMESNVIYYQSFNYYESNNRYYMDFLKISALFRHTSISGKVRPFFSGGITMSLPLRGEVIASYHRVGTSDYTESRYEIDGERGFVLSSGIKIENVEAEVRWERLTYRKTVFFLSNFVGLFVKYQFNKKI